MGSLRSKLAASLLVAAAVGVAVPGSASAADHSVMSPATTLCTSGGTAVALETVNVRDTPSTSGTIVHVVTQGTIVACDGYALGSRYDACGHSNANGWLFVYSSTWAGYAVATCFNQAS
jgi:hypothetical protein